MSSSFLYFKCCDVLENGSVSTSLCWSCGNELGVRYWEEYSDVPLSQMPYGSGTSAVHMSFSQVKSEFLKCLTP